MTKSERLLIEIASRLAELARGEITGKPSRSGKGTGHFRTVAEIRTAVERHEVQIAELRRDVTGLADMVADVDGGSRRRDGKRKPRGQT